MGSLAKQLSGQSQVKMMAKGGAVKHDDVAQDKKLIAQALKDKGLKKGGGVKGCADGGVLRSDEHRPVPKPTVEPQGGGGGGIRGAKKCGGPIRGKK